MVRKGGLKPPALSVQGIQSVADVLPDLNWWTNSDSNRNLIPCRGTAFPLSYQPRKWNRSPAFQRKHNPYSRAYRYKNGGDAENRTQATPRSVPVTAEPASLTVYIPLVLVYHASGSSSPKKDAKSTSPNRHADTINTTCIIANPRGEIGATRENRTLIISLED